jgi:hypothetical protein
MHISNNGIDVKRLVGALQKRVIVDMDEQACSEVRAGLDAYYKVSCHAVDGLLSLCKTRPTNFIRYPSGTSKERSYFTAVEDLGLHHKQPY